MGNYETTAKVPSESSGSRSDHGMIMATQVGVEPESSSPEVRNRIDS